MPRRTASEDERVAVMVGAFVREIGVAEDFERAQLRKLHRCDPGAERSDQLDTLAQARAAAEALLTTELGIDDIERRLRTLRDDMAAAPGSFAARPGRGRHQHDDGTTT